VARPDAARLRELPTARWQHGSRLSIHLPQAEFAAIESRMANAGWTMPCSVRPRFRITGRSRAFRQPGDDLVDLAEGTRPAARQYHPAPRQARGLRTAGWETLLNLHPSRGYPCRSATDWPTRTAGSNAVAGCGPARIVSYPAGRPNSEPDPWPGPALRQRFSAGDGLRRRTPAVAGIAAGLPPPEIQQPLALRVDMKETQHPGPLRRGQRLPATDSLSSLMPRSVSVTAPRP